MKNRAEDMVNVNYSKIEERIVDLETTPTAVSQSIGRHDDWFGKARRSGGRISRSDAAKVCRELGLDIADIVTDKNHNASGDCVHVNYDLIHKTARKKHVTLSGLSRALGYEVAYLSGKKREAKPLKRGNVDIICSILGLKMADVIIPEKQPEPEPVQEPEKPETDGADDTIKLTTPIAIDTADAIVTGLADIVSEAVSNQTVDIVEGMDALADAVVQLTGEVKRGQDLLRGCLLRIEKVLDKMEELKQ